MDDVDEGRLFEHVVFTIIPSDDLDTQQVQLLISSVIADGGVFVQTSSDGIVKLDDITHIVSTHIDFADYTKALDASIPVVKPNWIADSIAKRRQVTPRQYSPDPSQFFNNVIVSCGTLPESDENAIIAGVIALGGQYSSPLTKIVTHIVTMDLNNDKCRIAVERSLPIRIVLPHWFDDCLKLGKKIDERPYELPDPQILRQDDDEPVRINSAPAIEGASASRPDDLTLPITPAKTRRDLNAFQGKSVYLGEDLAINKHLKTTLGGLVKNGGGSVVSSLDAADIYVGHYRESDEFIDAFNGEKVIANLSWLYHVINTNRWTAPDRKLLHYPVPRHGIPGFDDFRVSVSNYSGDARTYVQNLVKECGATFTKTMKQDNTHLITAHRSSEKCEAAQEWGINMVNHLWLEESYAKCAAQSLTNPRYTTFPSRTNLGEICGQVGIDIKRIEQVYVLPRLSEKSRKPVKRRLFAAAIDDQESDVPLDDLFDEETEDGSVAEEESVLEPGKPVPQPRSKPDVIPSGKENLPPSSRGGRAAKSKALNTLHAQADDIALFNQQMKRKGGLVHGRDRTSTGDSKGKKRTSDAAFESVDPNADLSYGSTQIPVPAKKSKTAPSTESVLPPITHRLMVTGDDRWNEKPAKESNDRIKLRRLGVMLTQDPKEVDILVAPKILRTRKFVVAIASAPRVVDSKYLDTALDNGKLTTDPPTLVDVAGEKSYNFSLNQALERAKTNKHRLFRGWEIYVSDHLPGGFDTYKEIITANGGNALVFRGNRRGLTIKKRLSDDPAAGEESQNQGDEDEFQHAYLIAGDSPAEKALWKQFSALAREQDLEPRVMKAEWVLLAALSQQIRYNPQWGWNEEE